MPRSTQFENVNAIVLDIEGTLCPISFVRETLFPYALESLSSIIEGQWNDKSFAPYKAAFPGHARASAQAFEAHVRDLTARDVKIGYLKDLQGYLWENGYKTGKFATPFYPDVRAQLEAWHSAEIALYVYSSGSIFAQKLMFEYSDDAVRNDYTDLIHGWYDTNNAGPKTEAGSYDKIVHSLGTEAGKVLFLTDNVREVVAAKEAGLQVVLVDRPGNAAVSDEDRERVALVTSLEEVRV